MNSAILLALNTVALAALVMFHFQSTGSNDPAQISQQAVPHHLQQRPQLAVTDTECTSASTRDSRHPGRACL